LSRMSPRWHVSSIAHQFVPAAAVALITDCSQYI